LAVPSWRIGGVLLDRIARTSLEVADTSSRLAKIDLIASCLRRLRPEEVPVAVAYLAGVLPQGTIGIGWAALRELPPPAEEPALEVLELHAALTAISQTAGQGSQAARRKQIDELFGKATKAEKDFITRLLLGDLRQGALEGVMVEAIARATDTPASEVRRALMLAGDLGTVATAAVADGREGLARFRLQVLRPLQPMLAQTAEDLASALNKVGSATVEWKLDGARIQAHRKGGEVRVFTRNLADITDRAPEVVEAVRSLAVDSIVLDGEAIAIGRDERAQPFQVTMSRFGSKLQVPQLRAATPLSPFFFDCLHLDGEDLVDRSAGDRYTALSARVPEALRVPRIATPTVEEAESFFEGVLERGHEGVMVKALDAPYEAGRRGSSWIKVKRAHTLDLVVLAAEWGHGRRNGRLSNIHLGARDPAAGGFVMLGKTFKGMTDKMLEWQTERFLQLETRREGITVYIEPILVVEIAIDGVQSSPRYPAGMALRFARVKGYRPDKSPEQADSIDTVRAIFSGGQPFFP
jgi:DNA ligase-1